LFGGYAACYYCRADLSVATPLLVEELGKRGSVTARRSSRIGSISSLGVLAYALGKLFLTGLGDYWGGRRNFLIGVGGAAVFTLLFAAGGTIPMFTLAWLGNRLTQSIAGPELIKVSSRWFDYSSYGSIVGILSISYMIGDAAARQQMGMLIERGYGWRALFLFAAIAAAVWFTACLLWLRESRTELGHPEAKAEPAQPVCRRTLAAGKCRRAAAAAAAQPGVSAGLSAVLTCTIIRETFTPGRAFTCAITSATA